MSGNNKSGIRAVTGSGTVSVIHQVIIHAATLITFHATGFNSSGTGKKLMQINKTGPSTRLNNLTGFAGSVFVKAIEIEKN